MYNTIPTQQQKAQIIEYLVSEVHSLNYTNKTFDFRDGTFARHLIRMYIDAKQFYQQASAYDYNEVILQMFDRAVFDRGADGLVAYEVPEDKEEYPKEVTIDLKFVNNLFYFSQLIIKFLSQMQQHTDDLNYTTSPR